MPQIAPRVMGLWRSADISPDKTAKPAFYPPADNGILSN
jgi:hypothetical protein